MDKRLLDGVLEQTPDINPRIANGIATYQLQDAERYVDMIFQCAAQDFPEGLTYEGYRRCTPNEEFMEATRPRDNKQVFELARSDFYMVAYYFKFNGEEIFPRYLYLPYVERGGLIHVRGKQFAIHPVLADPAFSNNAKSMFIQLTRTRLTFERVVHHFMTNDSREVTYVVWSWVHSRARQRLGRRPPGTRVVYSTMANYLFANFGVTQTLKEFAGADVVVGEDDINYQNYPKDEWVICSSTGIKPRAWSGTGTYQSSRVRIAVPKDQYNQTARSLIGGFFYIVDHYPHRVKAEYVDDPWVWKVLLGYVIFGPGMGEGLMVSEIEDHLTSMDEYIDFIVKEDLRRSGITVDNINELFIYVIDSMAKNIVSSNAGISSIYNKRLITLRYVLFDIVSQINTLMYRLKAAQKKRAKLDETEIVNLMNKYLRNSRIDNIRNHAKHPEVTPISTSCDNLFFGVTSAMLTQENASNSGGKKSKINLRDPATHLHASIAEVASYNNLPKSDPTGRSRINPCLKLGPDDMVLRDPDKKDLLDHVQLLLSQ